MNLEVNPSNNVVYNIRMKVGKYEDVLIELEYSIGDQDTDLELAIIAPAQENFTAEELDEIEDELYSNYTYREDICAELAMHYENTSWRFNFDDFKSFDEIPFEDDIAGGMRNCGDVE